ncbi:hypothetical protein PMAYCL1PPCAC_06063, partial [Pristionchus mayeri]
CACGLNYTAQDYKKKHDKTMEPKEEAVNEPLVDIDHPFGLDFIDDEIKKVEILNDNLMEPKEELIDEPLSDVDQQYGQDFIDELKDEPILSEHMCTGREFTLNKLGKVTPQCILCKKYPTTLCECSVHLRRQHKTTLKANGIYFTCACGFNYTTVDDYKKHDDKV